jgi:hypothetical protein
VRRALVLPATPLVALGMVLGALTATTTAVVASALDDKPAFAQGKGGLVDRCERGQAALHNPNCPPVIG